MAMAVGNTKDGESFPAKPVQRGGGGNISIQSGEGVVGTSGTHLASSNPYRCMRISLQNSNESRRGAHLSMTTAGVWLAISMKLETN